MTKETLHLDWINPASGASIKIRVTRTRNYLSSGTDHIEIESMRPKKAPLPITETGYRSHFLRAEEVMREGGVQSFVMAWLNHEAESPSWKKQTLKASQDDLFAWAEKEVARKKVSPSRRKKPKLAPKAKSPKPG